MDSSPKKHFFLKWEGTFWRVLLLTLWYVNIYHGNNVLGTNLDENSPGARFCVLMSRNTFFECEILMFFLTFRLPAAVPAVPPRRPPPPPPPPLEEGGGGRGILLRPRKYRSLGL